MKKLLGLIAAGLILLGSASPTQCVTESLDANTILVYGKITDRDCVEFGRLTRTGEKEYTILLNSSGGSAFAMANMVYRMEQLKASNVKVITRVSGMAMSAAAILWVMGSEREIHVHDIVMFHGVQMLTQYGQPIPREKMSDSDKLIQDELNAVMIDRLAEIVGKKKAVEMTKGDNYYTGAQLYDLGVATRLFK